MNIRVIKKLDVKKEKERAAFVRKLYDDFVNKWGNDIFKYNRGDN